MNRDTQAGKILGYMRKAGSISSREAMLDLGLEANALTARISEMQREGEPIRRERRIHPISQKKYTRYFLDA